MMHLFHKWRPWKCPQPPEAVHTCEFTPVKAFGEDIVDFQGLQCACGKRDIKMNLERVDSISVKTAQQAYDWLNEKEEPALEEGFPGSKKSTRYSGVEIREYRKLDGGEA